MRRYFLYALAIAGLFASCTREPAVGYVDPGNKNDEAKYEGIAAPGWIRIKLQEDAAELRVGEFTRGAAETGNPELDKIAASLGATEVRRVFTEDPRYPKRFRKHGLHLWYDIKFDESVSLSRAETEFGKLDGVEHVLPLYYAYALDGADYVLPSQISASGIPDASETDYTGNQREMPFNDPGLKYQWHYDNDGTIENSVAGADIGLFAAWDKFNHGNPEVIVAVMDTGVYYEHEDLKDNMWINTGEIPGNGIDDDGNGYIDDYHGYDFYERKGDVTPGSHGTHVAGTIAAINGNGIGVSGIVGGSGPGNGDGVRIMTLQVYSADGYGIPDPDAFRYAADNGAVISQNSWGYPYTVTSTPADMLSAFQYFNEEAGCDDEGNQTGPMKGGVIVFAAGNEYSAAVGIPGDDDRVIAVTSMTPNFSKANYSNYGVDADIFAPGGADSNDTLFGKEGMVWSTDLDNGYCYMSGTSMACPHVSGICAMIVSEFGGNGVAFTSQDCKDRLLRAYRSVDAYQKNDAITSGLGVGLAYAPYIDMQNPGTAPAAPESASVTDIAEEKLSFDIEVPADGDGNPVREFEITYGKKSDENAWTTAVYPNRKSVGETVSFEFACPGYNETYVFRAYSIDRFGTKSETYVEAEGTTRERANREPELLKPFEKVTLPQTVNGKKVFEATLTLSEYITDADLEYGDVLTFSSESKAPEAVKVEVVDNAQLKITGLKKTDGNVIVAISASDKAGATISKNMAVSVDEDPEGGNGNGNGNGNGDKEPELPAGKIIVQFAADGSTMTLALKEAGDSTARVRIFDSAARQVMDTDVTFAKGYAKDLPVDDLAHGVYSITIKVGDTTVNGNFLKQ